MDLMIRNIRVIVAYICLSILFTRAQSYTFYTVVAGDNQSSIAVAHNVSPAAIQLANPQLSDEDYELVGEAIQIPAACSSQVNTHLTVPGDTIGNIAKDYGVDLTCLENFNPQISDPSTLNPGDCLQIPVDCSSSASSSSVLESPQSPSSWSSAAASSLCTTATAPSISASACDFTISSSGGIEGPAGQLSDGQIRINGSYATSHFSINGNGQITDSSGRGCIITSSPTTQFQCDSGAAPIGGFSIGDSRILSYNNSEVFYACPATDTEYNLYIDPNFGQTKCVKVTLTTSGCAGSRSSVSVQPPSTFIQTTTDIISIFITQTIWETITTTGSGETICSQSLSGPRTLSTVTTGLNASSSSVSFSSTGLSNSSTLISGSGTVGTGTNPPPTSSSSEEIVVGGSTYWIGTAPQTITENGQTIVLGGTGGFEIGSSTISIPSTGDGAITTDGITISYSNPSGGSASASPTSTPPEIFSISGTVYTLNPSSPIVIGSETLSLPQITGSTTITTDGVTLTVEPQTSSSGLVATSTPEVVSISGSVYTVNPTSPIVIGSDTLTLPEVSGSTTITTDGLTLTLGPGSLSASESLSASGSSSASSTAITPAPELVTISGSTYTVYPSSPVFIGSNTFTLPIVASLTTLTTDGIIVTVGPAVTSVSDADISSLVVLQPTASAIASAMNALVGVGSSWSAGSLSDDAAVSEISSLLSAVGDSISSWSSGVDRIPGINVYPPIIQQAETNAVQEVAQAFDAVAALKKLLTNFNTLKTILARNILQTALGALIIYGLSSNIWLFANINIRTRSPPKQTLPPVEFFLTTITGTPEKIFQLFIKGLPDKGSGRQIVYDNINWQGYVTQMTIFDALTWQFHPLVNILILDLPQPQLIDDSIDDSTASPTTNNEKRQQETPIVQPLPCPTQLERISQSPQDVANHVLNSYTYDAIDGLGINLYVLDTGFLVGSTDFPRGIATSHLCTKGDPDVLILDDTLNHGHCVASVAAGTGFGVAKSASLIPVKFKNGRSAKMAAIEESYMWTLDDIKGRGFQGQAVINYSSGSEMWQVINPAALIKEWRRMLATAWDYDVVTVFPAGNSKGVLNLSQMIPGQLGTDTNPMITVGGVNPDGSLWAGNTPLNNGNPVTSPNTGSLTVYAQSSSIECSSNLLVANSQSGKKGTSYAAPAVAGLAAYLLSLPELKSTWTTGSVAQQVKDRIAGAAHTRFLPWVAWPNGAPQPFPDPGPAKVAYNEIATLGCSNPGSFGKRADTCPVSSSSTTMVSTSSSTTSTNSISTSRISSSTSTSTFSTPISVPSITVPLPTTTGICDDTGHQFASASVAMSVPSAIPSIEVFIPMADPVGQYSFTFTNSFAGVQPQDEVSSWQVTGSVSQQIASGSGGVASLNWSNPNGIGDTILTLDFISGVGTQSYGAVVTADLPCVPPPTTTTSSYPPWPDTTGAAGFHIVDIKQTQGIGAGTDDLGIVGSGKDTCVTVGEGQSHYGVYGFLGDGNNVDAENLPGDPIPASWVNSSTTQFWMIGFGSLISGSDLAPICGITSSNPVIFTFTNTAAQNGAGAFSFKDSSGTTGTCIINDSSGSCTDKFGLGWDVADLMICEADGNPSYCADW